MHVQYASKKSCQYRLPFHRFQFRFPRRSVLPFYRSVHRFTVHRFTVPFCRFTVLPFLERAVIAGECLEVLKLGRCSATILMVDTYAEPFGERPIDHPCERTFRGNACCQMVRQVAAWFGHNCATETAARS